jgi:hypothetical protein
MPPTRPDPIAPPGQEPLTTPTPPPSIAPGLDPVTPPSRETQETNESEVEV